METPSWSDRLPGRVVPPLPAGSPGGPAPRWRWAHPLLFALCFAALTFSGGFFWEAGPDDGPVSWSDLLASGLPYALWVLAILGSHEMGHYLTCRYYGIPATLPLFLPGPPPLGTFGAVIRIRGRIPDRRALFDVAAAGPLAGFVVALAALVLGLSRAEPLDLDALPEEGRLLLFGQPIAYGLLRRWISGDLEVIGMSSLTGAGWVGMLVTSLNLFPVGQLDGGHAAYALSRRLHRLLSRSTLFALTGVIVAQVYMLEFPSYLLWFVILLWMRDRHPRLLDESTPLGTGRKLVAVILAIVFLLTFIFLPIRVVEL